MHYITTTIVVSTLVVSVFPTMAKSFSSVYNTILLHTIIIIVELCIIIMFTICVYVIIMYVYQSFSKFCEIDSVQVNQ